MWLRLSRMTLVLCGVVLVGGLTSGCAGWFSAPPEARLEGTVLRANAGEPVAQSEVTARGLTKGFVATTYTDAAGRFTLSVYPDRYEITLKKRDHAGSRVVGLQVTDRAEITLFQQKAFNLKWSTIPPQIELKGVGDNSEFIGPIPYSVTVTGENDPYVIYAALGRTPGSGFLTSPRQAFFSTPTTGDQILDPAAFGVRGPTNFEVVTYDKNNNRTHLIKYIRVLAANALPAPAPVRAIAVTVGKRIDFLQKPMQIARPAGAPIVIESAPANTNLFVQITWGRVLRPGATGYRVYRSFDRYHFAPAATLPASRTTFVDASPELAPGRIVYYRVVALAGTDEGLYSPIIETVPLAPFDVRLIEPADHGIDVARSPTFRWKPTATVGAVQAYGVILFDTVQGDYSWWLTPDPPRFLLNRTSYAWNEDGKFDGTPWETLQPHRVYEWEVAYAVALDNLSDPRAVSIAVDRYSSQSRWPSFPVGTSATDNFSFTTGETLTK